MFSDPGGKSPIYKYFGEREFPTHFVLGLAGGPVKDFLRVWQQCGASQWAFIDVSIRKWHDLLTKFLFNLHLNVPSLGYKYRQRELSHLEILSGDLVTPDCELRRPQPGKVGIWSVPWEVFWNEPTGCRGASEKSRHRRSMSWVACVFCLNVVSFHCPQEASGSFGFGGFSCLCCAYERFVDTATAVVPWPVQNCLSLVWAP